MRPLSLSLAFLFACLSMILGTAASAFITVGALDIWGQVRDVEVVGDIAYVAAAVCKDPDCGDRSGVLHIIDVSNPAFPVKVGALDTPGGARDVEVVGDIAYVAAGSYGLSVIDVSNPAFPVKVGALDTPGQAYDVEVVGDLAYVADYFLGLRVIDVSNPALPVEVGALDTPDAAYDVEVVGNLGVGVSSWHPGAAPPNSASHACIGCTTARAPRGDARSRVGAPAGGRLRLRRGRTACSARGSPADWRMRAPRAPITSGLNSESRCVFRPWMGTTVLRQSGTRCLQPQTRRASWNA